MPHQLPRIHVPGGLYYVAHRCDSSRPIFANIDDYMRFEHIVSQALEKLDVTAHAFCWLPESIYLAVQVGEVPLSRLMQAVLARYLRSLQLSEPLFRRRHQAWLVDPRYLQQLVRYIHRIPCAQDGPPPADFRWSSHQAYLGTSPLPWLTTDVVLGTFSSNPHTALGQYQTFMAEEVSAKTPKHFVERGCNDPRIIGDALFVAQLPRHLPIKRTTQTIESIIQSVLLQQGITRDQLISERTTGSLARALVTYHAVVRRIATYRQLAKVLRRNASTLHIMMNRYRTSESHAHLFKVSVLHNADPIGGLPFTS